MHPYLNPIELLGLTGQPDLTPAMLRKAKKRFLTELQLDDRDDFTYYGRLFTRNDLDRVTEETNDPAALAAYALAAEQADLSELLAGGELADTLTWEDLYDERLRPVLHAYLAPVYNDLLARAVGDNDLPLVDQLTDFDPTVVGIADSAVYEGAYRVLDRRVDEVVRVIEAYFADPRSPEARSLYNMRVIHDNFRKGILVCLPDYFADVINKLVSRVKPYAARLNNEQKKPRSALAMVEVLQGLPHLSEANHSELQTMSMHLIINKGLAERQRRGQTGAPLQRANSGEDNEWSQVIFYVLAFVAMLGAVYFSKHYDRPQRQRAQYRSVFSEPSYYGNTPSVEDIEQALRSYNNNKDEEKALRELNDILAGRSRGSDAGTEAVRRAVRDALDQVIDNDQDDPPPPPSHYRLTRPATSFNTQIIKDFLGPRANLPNNYHLFRIGDEDDGQLIKVRATVEHSGVSALLIWRDTLGLRQIRTPAGSPITLHVATGQVDRLTEGYVVYGKGWSNEHLSPWGATGWFGEVLCYCGPDHHGAFVDGKKSYRKNLWFPTSRVDYANSLSTADFLRGIKSLR